jgi:hypothetical protein
MENYNSSSSKSVREFKESINKEDNFMIMYMDSLILSIKNGTLIILSLCI